MTLLVAEHLGFGAPGDRIIDDVSLTLDAGEIVTVIGPNGSGKTTLLRLLTGVLRPAAGTVRRRPGLRTGYVPQKLAIGPATPMTLARFLSLDSARGRKFPPLLARLGLQPFAEEKLQRQLSLLSGGEMQRALLARALLREPELLVLDEPTRGMDPRGQAELYGVIENCRRETGCAVLMVSHDLYVVMRSSDRIICLNHHICCQGRPADVVSHPGWLSLSGAGGYGNLAPYRHDHDHAHDTDLQ